MRLLNSRTLCLEEFIGSSTPPYAILSHRWESEEVTFFDMSHESKEAKQGWAKIVGCCKQAVKDDWDWIWVDTCCIDKTSSAELSEAINSMFSWYLHAKVCYVYLSDVPAGKRLVGYDSLKDSLWFTRGWTLQELLAPNDVIFYDQEWNDIGTKRSLQSSISVITGISRDDLDGRQGWENACVARKLSWMSSRRTTRVEDMAYCLLGLLQINMPIIYGEGRNSFLRLQLELINSSDDESIFAWSDNDATYMAVGLLAHSPEQFASCRHIVRRKVPWQHYIERKPYTMTNKGLHMEHIIWPDPQTIYGYSKSESFSSLLSCGDASNNGNLAIAMVETADSHYLQRVGVKPTSVDWTRPKTKLYLKTKYSRQRILGIPLEFLRPQPPKMVIDIIPLVRWGFIIVDQWNYNQLDGHFTLAKPIAYGVEICRLGSAALVFLDKKSKREFVVILNVEYAPSVNILELHSDETHMETIKRGFSNCEGDSSSMPLRDGMSVSVVLRPARDIKKYGDTVIRVGKLTLDFEGRILGN